jgi:hypothetical protein
VKDVYSDFYFILCSIFLSSSLPIYFLFSIPNSNLYFYFSCQIFKCINWNPKVNINQIILLLLVLFSLFIYFMRCINGFKKKFFFSSFSYFPMILRSDFFYQFQIQNLGVTGDLGGPRQVSRYIPRFSARGRAGPRGGERCHVGPHLHAGPRRQKG